MERFLIQSCIEKGDLYPVRLERISYLFKKLSSEAFKNSGRTACLFSCERPAVHVWNSQSVLESGWFFPLFDEELIAQPSWALGVPGKEKCEVSACYTISLLLILDLACGSTWCHFSVLSLLS